jgi:hypothetical protein
VVLAIAELSRAITIKRLGQHHHHFDAIWLLFDTTQQSLDHVTWSETLSSFLNNSIQKAWATLSAF